MHMHLDSRIPLLQICFMEGILQTEKGLLLVGLESGAATLGSSLAKC